MNNSLRKIIFIQDSPFFPRDYRRFGIDLLKKNGFIVEIWDITRVMHPDVPYPAISPEDFGTTVPMIFSERKALIRALNELDGHETAVHSVVPFSYRSLYLYRALSKKPVYYMVNYLNSVPDPIHTSTHQRSKISWKKAYRKFFLYPKKRFIEGILDRLVLRGYPFFGIRAANLCLLGGLKSKNTIGIPVDAATQYLWGHTLDYDIYLSLRDEPDHPADRCGVFIDQNLPFFTDSVFNNDFSVCDADPYYPALCRFFSYLEKTLDLKIVIAAHPGVADPGKYRDYFEGREVIKGDTGRLVRQSEIVIAHASTAINLGVLFEKPIIIVTSDQLNNSTMRSHIDSFAYELDKEPVNVDKAITIGSSTIYAVNREKYRHFKENYIKTAGSEDQYLWQIVSDYLHGIRL